MPRPLGAELEILRDFLKSRGYRFTPEREAVAREAFGRHDHFTVDELYLGLRKKRRISRASLYRTIPLLIQAGLLSEVYTESGQTRYEHTFGHEHHCHLRCLGCGEVREFSEPGLPGLEERVSRQHGYQPRGHRLEVLGLCPRCREDDNRQ